MLWRRHPFEPRSNNSNLSSLHKVPDNQWVQRTEPPQSSNHRGKWLKSLGHSHDHFQSHSRHPVAHGKATSHCKDLTTVILYVTKILENLCVQRMVQYTRVERHNGWKCHFPSHLGIGWRNPWCTNRRKETANHKPKLLLAFPRVSMWQNSNHWSTVLDNT